MTSTDLKTPDATSSWVDGAPEFMRPYLRLMRADRPVGIWLLFLPCIWGLLLARPDDTTARELYGFALLFFIGAFAMRSAGCVYNDIIDKDIDAKVARTASRPLASGQLSTKQAWALLIGLCLLGLIVLLQLGLAAILIGLGSLALVAAYPFMKRITWWPQAWLGLTFNWGVLVGAATISGGVSLSVLLMYLAGIFWTLGYDTIYALQDREDDALVGVKSSARRLGDKTKSGVALFYGMTVALTGAALLAQGVQTWIFLLAPAGAHFAWQVATLNVENGDLSLRLFKSNVWAGALLCLPLLAV